MAPGILSSSRSSSRRFSLSPIRTKVATIVKNCLLNRSVNVTPLRASAGIGNEYILEDGTRIYDASGGAAVANIGKKSPRVMRAMKDIHDQGLAYVSSFAFDTKVTAELANWMITSTENKMSKAVFYCSGSEASEAALKIIMQYHGVEKCPAEPEKKFFIAREQSYHGATLGALDLSGHTARKAFYHKILPGNMHTIPACNPYRNQIDGQTDAAYVAWHKNNLIKKVEELGPKNVAAFIVEPVVGAALGCAPAVKGYLKAMKEVCDHYGMLLVFDEVMCGMGRTGYLHAWQAENVTPDIQLVGKGLAGGFFPISSMLVGHKIIEVFENGPSNGAFSHGHTFQNSPMGAAAALEVQRIVEDEHLLLNVREKGRMLEEKLRDRLAHHRYVGDIRGPKEGLFYALEFVQDKETKTPFPKKDAIWMNIFNKGLTKHYAIHVYPGSGSADGVNGDHIILAPAFNITRAEVDLIVERVGRLVEDFFDEYDEAHPVQP